MSELHAKELGVKSLREETRSVDFVASTASIDSYDEVVEQDWDLSRFKVNPVVLYGHQSRELPVGRCTSIGVVNGQLECTVEFLKTEANPKAEQVWQCLKAQALRAVSVGFVPGDVRLEKRDGKDIYVLSKNVLHEVSVVPIPANQDAIAKMRSKAREAATTNESATARQEKTMDELEKVKAALGTSETKVTELSKELAAALAKAKAADLEVVGKNLDVLVGKKITPAEKENLLELAAANRTMFEKMLVGINARPDMKLLEGVIPGEKALPPAGADAAATDNGDSLVASVNADLAKTG